MPPQRPLWLQPQRQWQLASSVPAAAAVTQGGIQGGFAGAVMAAAVPGVAPTGPAATAAPLWSYTAGVSSSGSGFGFHASSAGVSHASTASSAASASTGSHASFLSAVSADSGAASGSGTGLSLSGAGLSGQHSAGPPFPLKQTRQPTTKKKDKKKRNPEMLDYKAYWANPVLPTKPADRSAFLKRLIDVHSKQSGLQVGVVFVQELNQPSPDSAAQQSTGPAASAQQSTGSAAAPSPRVKFGGFASSDSGTIQYWLNSAASASFHKSFKQYSQAAFSHSAGTFAIDSMPSALCRQTYVVTAEWYSLGACLCVRRVHCLRRGSVRRTSKHWFGRCGCRALLHWQCAARSAPCSSEPEN